jgi:hypothetical protein
MASPPPLFLYMAFQINHAPMQVSVVTRSCLVAKG